MEPRDLTPEHIARAMGISLPELWYRIRRSEEFYRLTRKVWIKNKWRDIDEPISNAKANLRLLHRFIQKEFRSHPNSYGGVKGKSYFTAARHHLGKKLVVTRDAKDCFPSITSDMLRGRLVQHGFRPMTACVLSGLMTVRGKIPQGSPISNDALNFYLHDADRALSAVGSAMGASYHRNCDDMVMSTNNRRAFEKCGALIERQISLHGLTVNAKKREKDGYQLHDKRRQFVHNLDVTDARGIGIKNELKHKALDEAEGYIRGSRCVTPDSLVALACKRRSIMGLVHHFRQADFSNAPHIRKLVKAGDRHIEARLKSVGLTPYRGKWWVISEHNRNEPARLRDAWKRRPPVVEVFHKELEAS